MLPMASSSLSSSSSATVAVDKATSDLLISPDWTMNIDICDSVNSHHWQAKDVVKALKRRLQHKNPKVQLLALTLLETMVKNCGDYLHFQVAERNILGEMIKIVKKKADMQVREKILVLLDSWQEAFGGPGGKHAQYYWAYEELRRSGVDFPKRSLDASPIFTPPPSHPSVGRPQPGYGMPSNASRRLDETMATEIESLSLSSIEAMRNVSELLFDMLQAVNPSDRSAVKDEVIVELVNRCRTNQKKLMQMLTSTGDEELLARGLDLNDSLQVLLARHDAIASGSPLPLQLPSSSPPPAETSVSSPNQSEVRDSAPRDVTPRPSVVPSVPVTTTMTRTQIYEEEEEDEFAQLARRHSKAPSNGAASDNLALVSVSTFPSTETASSSSNALALRDPPAPAKTREQDIIDMLSITLTTTEASTNASLSPPPHRNVPPVSPDPGYSSQTYSGVQTLAPNSGYVVPWAQPPKQMQSEARPTYSSGYIPPPWASTPGYYTSPAHFPTNNTYATHTNTVSYTPGQAAASNNRAYIPAQANNTATSSYTPAHAARPLQSHSSFTARENGFTVSSGESPAQKPFVPSYRLFEDLNVFGGPSGNPAGASGQSMVGGRK